MKTPGLWSSLVTAYTVCISRSIKPWPGWRFVGLGIHSKGEFLVIPDVLEAASMASSFGIDSDGNTSFSKQRFNGVLGPLERVYRR